MRIGDHSGNGLSERIAGTGRVGDSLLDCGTELRRRRLFEHATNVIRPLEMRSNILLERSCDSQPGAAL